MCCVCWTPYYTSLVATAAIRPLAYIKGNHPIYNLTSASPPHHQRATISCETKAYFPRFFPKGQ